MGGKAKSIQGKREATKEVKVQVQQEAEAETEVPENNWQRCKLSGVKRDDAGTGQGGKKTQGRRWRRCTIGDDTMRGQSTCRLEVAA